MILETSSLLPLPNKSTAYASNSHKSLFGALKHPSVLSNSDNLAEFRLSLPVLSNAPPNIMNTLTESKLDETMRTGVDSGYESPGRVEDEWIAISKIDFKGLERPFNSWEGLYDTESVSLRYITAESSFVFDKIYKRFGVGKLIPATLQMILMEAYMIPTSIGHYCLILCIKCLLG